MLRFDECVQFLPLFKFNKKEVVVKRGFFPLVLPLPTQIEQFVVKIQMYSKKS